MKMWQTVNPNPYMMMSKILTLSYISTNVSCIVCTSL